MQLVVSCKQLLTGSCWQAILWPEMGFAELWAAARFESSAFPPT